MGKKGSKSSLIKRFFACCNNSLTLHKRRKEPKKLTHGGSKWFVIPAMSFREPSSIHKILADHEGADQMILTSPTTDSHVSANAACSMISCGPKETQCSKKQDVSATTIQAAYRGYLARRYLRSLRGVERLHGVMRSHKIKLKATNDVKQMQRFVRVQMQVQSQRHQRLQNQQNQTKCIEIADKHGDWNDSLLTMVELEARRRQKVDASIKRERTMAYANTHQMCNSNKKFGQSCMDIRSNDHPWWWKWLEGQLPLQNADRQTRLDSRKLTLTPTRDVSVKDSPKVRANSNPKERVQGEESQRSSFSPSKNKTSFKWNSNNHASTCSMGDNLSMVSTASMSARKPFNRFV